MRDAARLTDEYLLELQPELIVGLDVVTHVIVLKYFKILAKVAIVR